MRRWFVVMAALALVAAACSDDSDDGNGTVVVVSDPTAPPGADAPEPEGSVAGLAITEVAFGDHVTITNVGAATVTIEALWLCNRPAYTSVAVSLAPGESQRFEASSLGGLTADGGEVALYSTNSFGDSTAIVDYVAWGSGGGRGSVAAEAGIWPDGDVVQRSGAVIFAPGGGASSADWASQ